MYFLILTNGITFITFFVDGFRNLSVFKIVGSIDLVHFYTKVE